MTAGHASVPGPDQWLLAVLVGLLGLLQQFLLITALTLEQAAKVAVVRQTQLVIAYLIQASGGEQNRQELVNKLLRL